MPECRRVTIVPSALKMRDPESPLAEKLPDFLSKLETATPHESFSNSSQVYTSNPKKRSKVRSVI